MQRIDAEVLDELKNKLGLVNLDEKEKEAAHAMKDNTEKLMGYDVSHRDHGEGLRKEETKVQQPENNLRRANSKWFSR